MMVVLKGGIGLTSENAMLKNMLDTAICAIACCQIILRDDKTDYKLVEFNRAFEVLSGHDRSWLLGRCLGDDRIKQSFPDFDPAGWITEAIEARSTKPLNYIGNKSYELFLHRLNEDHLIITLCDVTDLHGYRHKFEQIFNTTGAILNITTFKEGEVGIYVDLNEPSCEAIGLPKKEIIGHKWTEINVIEDPSDYLKIAETMYRDKRLDNFELVITNQRGERRIGLMSCEVVRINNQDYTFSIIHDITEFRRIEAELAEKNQQLTELNHLLSQQAIRDDLTGLYNRRHIFQILKEKIIHSNRYAESLSLMMIDLDEFKNVNDTYGHQFGDFMLQAVARIIIASIRESDFLGRYGGEEFLLILTHTDLESAKVVAQRIGRAVEEASFGENNVKMTVSIGICSYHGSSLEEFVKCADELMYQAKRTGRNRFVSE
jgi:diguanylate cyclase (GGDEF)-like protein/PAS domain S-box-containing protein